MSSDELEALRARCADLEARNAALERDGECLRRSHRHNLVYWLHDRAHLVAAGEKAHSCHIDISDLCHNMVNMTKKHIRECLEEIDLSLGSIRAIAMHDNERLTIINPGFIEEPELVKHCDEIDDTLTVDPHRVAALCNAICTDVARCVAD